VTLFDTYGEVEALLDRVRDFASDETNGAIIVFSFSHDVAFANFLVRAGAHGFISKGVPAPEIVDGIRAAARGERGTFVQRSKHAAMAPELGWRGREMRLTERESELLALLPIGMTNRELGAHFCISENTIKTHYAAFSRGSMSGTGSRLSLGRAQEFSANTARGAPTPAAGGSHPQPAALLERSALLVPFSARTSQSGVST
jgi:two-component system, NarL family, response regulator LiaR